MRLLIFISFFSLALTADLNHVHRNHEGTNNHEQHEHNHINPHDVQQNEQPSRSYQRPRESNLPVAMSQSDIIALNQQIQNAMQRIQQSQQQNSRFFFLPQNQQQGEQTNQQGFSDQNQVTANQERNSQQFYSLPSANNFVASQNSVAPERAQVENTIQVEEDLTSVFENPPEFETESTLNAQAQNNAGDFNSFASNDGNDFQIEENSSDNFESSVADTSFQGENSLSLNVNSQPEIIKSNRIDSTHCAEGLLADINGNCVEPEISRNMFLYAAPKREIRARKRIVAPKPKLEYNIVFVRNPVSDERQKPIVIPPPQKKTIVYVLNKKSEIEELDIIESPSYPAQKPEVFFVNYDENENPTLPGGVDLQTALQNMVLEGKVIGDSSLVRDFDYNTDVEAVEISGNNFNTNQVQYDDYQASFAEEETDTDSQNSFTNADFADNDSQVSFTNADFDDDDSQISFTNADFADDSQVSFTSADVADDSPSSFTVADTLDDSQTNSYDDEAVDNSQVSFSENQFSANSNNQNPGYRYNAPN